MTGQIASNQFNAERRHGAGGLFQYRFRNQLENVATFQSLRYQRGALEQGKDPKCLGLDRFGLYPRRPAAGIAVFGWRRTFATGASGSSGSTIIPVDRSNCNPDGVAKFSRTK